MSDTRLVLARVCAAIEEKQGKDMIVLDISQISSLADFFILCHGSNPKQVQAISESIRDALVREFQIRPAHIEGAENAEWILLDFLDFVIHIFEEPVRKFYNLEKLWGDAVKVEHGVLTA
jgi:ribosome-associated protein